jgi:hypothetical protein
VSSLACGVINFIDITEELAFGLVEILCSFLVLISLISVLIFIIYFLLFALSIV